MSTPRKLNPEQEREVALAFLCGVDTGYIKDRYGVADATVRTLIVGNRAPNWHDPLVDFYSRTDPFHKELNSVHLFLAFNGGNVPNGLIKRERERPVYELVRDSIYQPGIEAILQRTALKEYATGKHPYDTLMTAIFGDQNSPDGIVHDLLIPALQEVYRSEEKVSLKAVFRQVGDTIIDKVRAGALSWSDLKKSFVHDALKTLSSREEKVIGLRFGLDGYGAVQGLYEVGQHFDVGVERARQIEAKALRRLRHPSRSLEILTGLSTDAEVKSYLDRVQQQQEREYWRRELYPEIKAEVLQEFAGPLAEAGEPTVSPQVLNTPLSDLDLTIRSANCLQNANIKTIGELCQRSELELLKTRNFGRKSLREIKEILAELGLRLNMFKARSV